MLKTHKGFLRIGFDAKRAFNNHTGLGNYSRFILSSLLQYRKDSELLLFTPKTDPAYENLFLDDKRVSRITPKGIIGKSFPAAWRSFTMATELEKYHADVFHGLSNELPLGIGKFKGKKVVTIHDLIFIRYPDYYNNIDRYIYTRKFKTACDTADVVIATSAQTKSDIVDFFKIDPKKVTVLFQNCDARFDREIGIEEKLRIKNTYKLPEQFILCVGTIEQRKNQLTVLKAFHQAGIKDMHLVFVGRQTDYAKELTDYIALNTLQKKVQLIDFVAMDDLPGIYQHAELFVYASEFEGFGIPVVEAFRSKVPVILSNSSSLSEVGGEGAIYFTPNKVDELTALLQNLHGNDSVKKSIVEKGCNRLVDFDPEDLMEQLMRIYLR